MLCRVVVCRAVLYCAVLYCAVLYCTVLYCTVLYCTVLCCVVLCCALGDRGIAEHSILSSLNVARFDQIQAKEAFFLFQYDT